ncbi:MAG: beta-glucuronidase [Sphingobium sp.]|nr:beta-glucuronidase [Sphingobium sp.]
MTAYLRAIAGTLLALVLAMGAPLHAQPVLASADMRGGQDLSGLWHWSIDPYRDGLSGFHGGDAGTGHRRFDTVDPTLAMQGDPRALYEYDMGRSPTVRLPSSWITHTPEMRQYRGLVWYQREFAAQPKPGKRYFLRFGAAEYRARVWVNGRVVGSHEGGFTPFAFEVTERLTAGVNQVTIGVDSERTDADVPPPVTDWENYGGITRGIALIEAPQTYVDDAWVRLTADGRIVASGRLDGPKAAGMAVTVSIPALGFSLAATAGTDGSWSVAGAAPAGLERWSPEHPRLYAVEVRAGEDRLTDRIGFRTIAVRGHEILLNGKPVFLRGISLHEEELGANPTRNITPAAARALLDQVKTGLHGNFVRLAHYPHSEVMTRMADELGLIVWSEIPVYWLVDWSNPKTLSVARTMLAENIRRDRNRASIAIWSVGNETPASDPRNIFLGRLIADARALDDSRLVSAALLSRRDEANGRITMVIDDPLVPLLDVMAVNTYAGWYSNDAPSAVPAIDWRAPVDKPLIFSEFGADALAGFHDRRAAPQKFSEEYQAAYYRATLAMADRVGFLAGMSPWILKDFRSPRRQHPTFQQGWNRKGLISATGQRKQAFAVLAADYAARAAQEERITSAR